jgi:hypothetical protein
MNEILWWQWVLIGLVAIGLWPACRQAAEDYDRRAQERKELETLLTSLVAKTDEMNRNMKRYEEDKRRKGPHG